MLVSSVEATNRFNPIPELGLIMPYGDLEGKCAREKTLSVCKVQLKSFL